MKRHLNIVLFFCALIIIPELSDGIHYAFFHTSHQKKPTTKKEISAQHQSFRCPFDHIRFSPYIVRYFQPPNSHYSLCDKIYTIKDTNPQKIIFRFFNSRAPPFNHFFLLNEIT